MLLRLHREYWKFIGDHKLHRKPDVFNNKGKYVGPQELPSRCFLCAYAVRLQRRSVLASFTSRCNFCPCKEFRESSEGCASASGAFSDWCLTHSPKLAYKISRMKFTLPPKK